MTSSSLRPTFDGMAKGVCELGSHIFRYLTSSWFQYSLPWCLHPSKKKINCQSTRIQDELITTCSNNVQHSGLLSGAALRLHHEAHSHPSASLCRDLVSCSFQPRESTKRLRRHSTDKEQTRKRKYRKVTPESTININKTILKTICKLSRRRLVHLPAERAPQTLRFLQVSTSPRLAMAFGTF